MQAQTEHRGRVIDLHEGRIFPGVVTVENGLIASVRPDPAAGDEGGFLCPGFVDAHVHIESSMLAPAEFGRIAVTHGTTATVSDPHEIANVLGVDGVRAMQRFAAATPLKIHFGIPSCVPATAFETAGAEIGPAEVEELCRDPSFHYLSEVMNYPGVVHRDPGVMAKIAAAKRHGKRIDGHAPGLSGADLEAYVAAGIETDHECSFIDEAREKLSLGQKIIISEGSASKNFEELWPLLLEAPASCMFCSDDKHPDDLLAGHINLLCARAVAKGVPVLDVLRAACLHPVQHYGLGAGLLRPGDPADFIRLADLSSFRVLETFLNGHPVARDGVPLLPRTRADVINHFEATPKKSADFAVPVRPGRLRVIEAVDGRIVTGAGEADPLVVDGMAVADPSRDLLKIAVVNRYRDTPPAVAFVSGLGLRAGAMASSVAHDCHNIVAVGATDEDLARAVNLVIRHRGGISLAGPGGLEDVLPLPIAGIMSDGFAEDVAAGYSRLSRGAMNLGSGLAAPYMTLSFLALLVIPSLKLGDRGLFDGRSFGFVPLFTGG